MYRSTSSGRLTKRKRNGASASAGVLEWKGQYPIHSTPQPCRGETIVSLGLPCLGCGLLVY
jgi:hypothetical protein